MPGRKKKIPKDKKLGEIQLEKKCITKLQDYLKDNLVVSIEFLWILLTIG